MTINQLNSNLLGQKVQFEYSETWIGYALIFVRVAIGWIFLQAGLTKIFDPGWSAAGYLNNAIPEGNPFMGFWAALAGNPAVDFLNQWGPTLVGLGLILGVLLRWNAFWGAVIMLFYWVSSLQGGLAEGLPLTHGWVVDEHIVYIFLLFGLGAFGAGRILGFDTYLENTSVVQNNPWLKYLLG